MVYDVIVVGLGPAGATAAYECARRGLRVLALDKAQMPRRKPCGGAISSRIDRILGDGFHEVVEARVRKARVSFQGKDSFRVSSPETVAYMVRRERFDLYLCERARNSGAEVLLGEKVTGFEARRDDVQVQTPGSCQRGKWLVGADGAYGVVGRQLGLWPPLNPWIALEGELDFPDGMPGIDPGEVWIDFGSAPFGYGWAFPKRRHLSLGVAGNGSRIKRIHRLYEETLDHLFPGKGADGISTQGWILPLWRSSHRLISWKRVLLVGDAASLVDPFLGEGIYWGIRSGQIAAECLYDALAGGEDRVAAYDRRISGEIYPELRAAQKIAAVLYSFPQLGYEKIRERPHVFEEFFRVLQGEKTCRDWWGSLRTSVFRALFRTLGLPGLSKIWASKKQVGSSRKGSPA